MVQKRKLPLRVASIPKPMMKVYFDYDGCKRIFVKYIFMPSKYIYFILC